MSHKWAGMVQRWRVTFGGTGLLAAAPPEGCRRDTTGREAAARTLYRRTTCAALHTGARMQRRMASADGIDVPEHVAASGEVV